MAAPDRKPGQIQFVVLLAAAVILAGASGIAGVARQVAILGPAIGDIVTFDRSRPFNFDSTARLDVDRGGSRRCTLDVGVMQRSGGSLVVEQRTPLPSRLYRVHWAGARTDRGPADCGSDADFSLSSSDIEILSMASNGLGTGIIRMPRR